LKRFAVAVYLVAAGSVLAIGFLTAWMVAYSDDGDPRNIYYVLWKHGLNDSINLDSALAALLREPRRFDMVRGLTKDQLKARYGYVRTLGEVGPYYEACYLTPGTYNPGKDTHGEALARSEEALFLRNSPWMVTMKNGKVADLGLCKGY
jgi:hypothetical protein